ncbi:unnamed protein product [Tilletia controversa]|nr:unnamed protein product [Tilletia caries]CAD6943554.1 unnamed protein product [Tilletia controversa]CAD6947095.1 unnamed protein product [Tilletia controversa]CAD6957354.1 unnamed protein product [Tilletia caries]
MFEMHATTWRRLMAEAQAAGSDRLQTLTLDELDHVTLLLHRAHNSLLSMNEVMLEMQRLENAPRPRKERLDARAGPPLQQQSSLLQDIYNIHLNDWVDFNGAVRQIPWDLVENMPDAEKERFYALLNQLRTSRDRVEEVLEVMHEEGLIRLVEG